MGAIKETIRIPLSNLVVKPEDARKLGRVLVQCADTLAIPPNSRYEKKFIFEARSNVDTRYESESSEIFDESGILDTKQIILLRFSFSDYNTDSSIKIELVHGDSSSIGRILGSNNIEVGGRDSYWVNATARTLEETVSEIEKQAPWPRKWAPALFFVAVCGTGMLMYFFLKLLFVHILHTRFSIEPNVASWVPVIIVGIGGLFPGLFLTDKLLELWPSIELRMGKEWAQVVNKRRQRLWLFCSLVGLPIAYDLVKYIYNIFNH
jgi:hypothetical protein